MPGRVAAEDRCAGNDLWHFDKSSLAGIDGVLWGDCTIWWTKGGRAKARDVGMPCVPTR